MYCCLYYWRHCRLAADPGIVGIMSKHRWTVGLLSEMPPEGKVGVSPVCILGVNINAGQEISLRLRTDDLKGFRRYISCILFVFVGAFCVQHQTVILQVLSAYQAVIKFDMLAVACA